MNFRQSRQLISLLFLLCCTRELYADNSNSLLWPASQISTQALVQLHENQTMYYSNAEFLETQQVFSALAGSGTAASALTVFGRKNASFHNFSTILKLFSVDSDFLIQGVRSVLAFTLLSNDQPDLLASALAKLFGHWTPTLHEIWYSKATQSGLTLSQLFENNREISEKTYDECNNLIPIHHKLVCQSAVMVHIQKTDYQIYEREQKLIQQWQNFSNENPVRQCSPFYWGHQFLKNHDITVRETDEPANLTINFIWVGANMPLKYAENLKAWQNAYPEEEVVLWYLPKILSLSEQTAMAALSDHAGIQVKNLHDADLSNLDETARHTVKETLNQARKDDNKENYAAISDRMRVVLASSPNSNNQGNLKSYVYMDLDYEFKVSCGFIHPSKWIDDIAFHRTGRDSWADGFIAVRNGAYLSLENLIHDHIERLGRVLTYPGFDQLVTGRNYHKRAVSFLWNVSFHDVSYSPLGQRKDLHATWNNYYWTQFSVSEI